MLAFLQEGVGETQIEFVRVYEDFLGQVLPILGCVFEHWAEALLVKLAIVGVVDEEGERLISGDTGHAEVEPHLVVGLERLSHVVVGWE